MPCLRHYLKFGIVTLLPAANGANRAGIGIYCRFAAAAKMSAIALEDFHLPGSTVETQIKRDSPDFAKNTRRMVDLLTEIKNQEIAIQ